MNVGARKAAGPSGPAHTSSSSLHIQVLGAVSVLRGKTPVEVGPAMVRQLLAVLALNVGRTVSRDRIVHALWGEAPPATSRSLVHGYVSRLRAQLRDPSGSGQDETYVEREGSGYRLCLDPDQVDLVRFDKLCVQARKAAQAERIDDALEYFEQAFDCWRGEVLEDLDPRLRRLPMVTSITDRWIDSIIEYTILCRSQENHTAALAQLRRAVQSAPLHETLHAHLMTVQSTLGDRAGALEIYTDLRSRLAEELGVDPGAELQSVYLGILRERATEPVVRRPATEVAREPSRDREESPARTTACSGERVRDKWEAMIGWASQRPQWQYLTFVLLTLLLAVQGSRALLDANFVGVASYKKDIGVIAASKPVYYDNFNDGRIDLENWKLYNEKNTNGSIWTGTAVQEQGDELKITGKGKNPTGAGNTAGGMCLCKHHTYKKQYGRWEVRASFDIGAGYIPEIGLYPKTDDAEDGFITLASAENPFRLGASALIQGSNGVRHTEPLRESDLTSWNIYSVELRPGFTQVRINDRIVFDTRNIGKNLKLPTVPMYLYIQLHPGPLDNAPGPNEETPEQVAIHVDWVKFFK